MVDNTPSALGHDLVLGFLLRMEAGISDWTRTLHTFRVASVGDETYSGTLWRFT